MGCIFQMCAELWISDLHQNGTSPSKVRASKAPEAAILEVLIVDILILKTVMVNGCAWGSVPHPR